MTLSYTIYSPSAAQYALGADILRGANSFSDPGNDNLVNVPAGTSVVTRPFYIRTDATLGTYNVNYAFYDSTFNTQYGLAQQANAFTVIAATPTPTVLIPTYTPTIVATPSGPAVTLDVTGPGSTTVNAGTNISLSYRIINTTGSSTQVKLAAQLTQSGLEGYGPITDTVNQTTVTAPTGYSNFTRNFAIPATSGAGSYDLAWSLLDTSNNVLSTRTTKNLVWVNVTGNFPTGLTLSTQSMLSNTITLQNGLVNRAVGRFVIQNDTGQAAQAILRMRVKKNGTSTYVSDLASENLITAPTGSSTWTRPFAIPRYFTSGSYDVTFELGTPDFSGYYDNNLVTNAFTITNPSVVPNVGIPILMYHTINVTPLGNNSVSLVNFTQQMDYLANNGWHTITGEDMYTYIYKGISLPSQPIWLTFDDSYQNNYDYVCPVLSQRGLRGSIFTVTQYMGQMNSWDICCEPQHLHMTWSMLNQMRNANLAADSHTQHHVHFFDLNAVQSQAEVWGTQRDLVSFLGDAGLNFSYPYGQYPPAAEWAVAHSGFHSAVIIGQVKQYTNFAYMYELTRIGISGSDTLPQFINKITAP